MMKSLWSGVSGLQAHQVAMDVEGHNIANVNTVGFKYSRANFADMLSQTYKVATGPQGDLGGGNSLQVGLGSQVSSTTRIFAQGSTQTTDKSTDLAIQGDGFFVMTSDGGKSYKYTRNGDFNFDASGYLVDANGLIAQGWVKDFSVNGDDCGNLESLDMVDSSGPIRNIQIDPGLKIPAHSSNEVKLQANLNNGSFVDNLDCINQTPVDLNDVLDVNGKPFALTNNTSTITIDIGGTNVDFIYTSDPTKVDLTQNGVANTYKFRTVNDLTSSIEHAIETAVAGSDVVVKVASDGSINITNISATAVAINSITDVGANLLSSTLGGLVQTYNQNDSFASAKTSAANVKPDDMAVLFNASGNAFNLQEEQGLWVSFMKAEHTQTFNAAGNADVSFELNGITISGTVTATTSVDYVALLADLINQYSSETGVVATPESNKLILENDNTGALKNIKIENSTGNGVGGLDNINEGLDLNNPQNQDVTTAGGTLDAKSITSYKYQYKDRANIINNGGQTKYFKTTEDLRNALQQQAQQSQIDFGLTTPSAIVTVDSSGRFNFINGNMTTEQDLYVSIKGINDSGIKDNILFTQTFESLGGIVPSDGSVRNSQTMNAATWASSIDIYDSLGTKHSLRIEFRKTDDSRWDWTAIVPEPAELLGHPIGEKNKYIGGYVEFNDDGSLKSFNPPTLTFSANNGSKPNQIVQLDFGDSNTFNGVTSLDSKSTTSGISQDGYAGGDLLGIRADSYGNLVGSFTNGKSVALAQVSMAKFNNNAGLNADGDNLFSETANSGSPIIGTAGTGGRGTIKSSALEMSNVDLSRSLTQLIVIQRGYQANSKTITTADQLLTELLNIKR
ncbi:MAG: flagellar hook protein FlgE [Campylobacterales bacterium]|nr:flagellar hook protein FlgE [Campylobacterales bacterium]